MEQLVTESTSKFLLNPVCSHRLLPPPFALRRRRYLEKVDVPTGVAQAEHVLLLGMLWDRLHDAVLCKEGAPRGAILVCGILPVSLIKQQSTAWARQKQKDDPVTRPGKCRKGVRGKGYNPQMSPDTCTGGQCRNKETLACAVCLVKLSG